MFLQNLSGDCKGWSYGAILLSISWIGEAQTPVFFIQVGISGSYWDLPTSAVALGFSKSRGSSTSRNCLLASIFCFVCLPWIFVQFQHLDYRFLTKEKVINTIPRPGEPIGQALNNQQYLADVPPQWTSLDPNFKCLSSAYYESYFVIKRVSPSTTSMFIADIVGHIFD